MLQNKDIKKSTEIKKTFASIHKKERFLKYDIFFICN